MTSSYYRGGSGDQITGEVISISHIAELYQRSHRLHQQMNSKHARGGIQTKGEVISVRGYTINLNK